MTSSSSLNTQEAINLNVAPSAMPKVWHSYILFPNSLITITDFVMLNGVTATAVAAGLLIPEDERILAERTYPQTILHVKNHEVRMLRLQYTILQRLLKDNKKKVGELKEENK